MRARSGDRRSATPETVNCYTLSTERDRDHEPCGPAHGQTRNSIEPFTFLRGLDAVAAQVMHAWKFIDGLSAGLRTDLTRSVVRRLVWDQTYETICPGDTPNSTCGTIGAMSTSAEDLSFSISLGPEGTPRSKCSCSYCWSTDAIHTIGNIANDNVSPDLRPALAGPESSITPLDV